MRNFPHRLRKTACRPDLSSDTPHSCGQLVAAARVCRALAAMVATAFKWVLPQSEELMERLFAFQPWRAIAGGLVVGALAVWLPDVVGNGYEPLNELLDHRMAAAALGVLLLAKIIATGASVGSGVPRRHLHAHAPGGRRVRIAVAHIYPVIFRIGTFEVTSFGLMVGVGALVGLWLFMRELTLARIYEAVALLPLA